jgi:multicomponent Na+:H+ antiporter subunit B
MSARFRLALFVPGAAGLAALLLWGFAGLPSFGDYGHAYGTVVNRVELTERHATNVVSAVVFDYRGVDTMGEELILFAAAVGIALLLRAIGPAEVGKPRERVQSEALRAVGLVAMPVVVLLGLQLVAHGYLTPGGGFQGGVVLGGGLLLVYLAGEYRAFCRAAPKPLVDFAEGVGAGGFVALGLVSLALGYTFLRNFLPLGTSGDLLSAGSISLVNWAAGLEVAAALVLIMIEFLEEVMEERR